MNLRHRENAMGEKSYVRLSEMTQLECGRSENVHRAIIVTTQLALQKSSPPTTQTYHYFPLQNLSGPRNTYLTLACMLPNLKLTLSGWSDELAPAENKLKRTYHDWRYHDILVLTANAYSGTRPATICMA
jgi:hypothetical protein